MKNIILLLFGFCLFAKAHSQDTWKVSLNNKVVINGKSDPADLTAHLKSSAYKNFDKLVIHYSTGNEDTSWKRSFLINDENDSNLLTLPLNKQSGSVSIKSSVVKNLINKKKPFSIYTLSLPKDPSLAARVRIARVLLCKIEWN